MKFSALELQEYLDTYNTKEEATLSVIEDPPTFLLVEPNNLFFSSHVIICFQILSGLGTARTRFPGAPVRLWSLASLEILRRRYRREI